MTRHHLLSPSAAKAWLRCSMYPHKNLTSTTNPAAELGTAAHDLAERTLLGESPQYYVNKKLNNIIITQKIADHVQGYYDYCRQWVTSITCFQVEKKVKLSPFILDGYGTVDCLIVNGREAHIIDLKYGLIPVEINENKQLKVYALSLLRDRNVQVVHCHIYQPRCNNIGYYTYAVKELKAFGDEVGQAFTKILKNPEFSPHPDACQWCQFKAKCSAYYDHNIDLFSKAVEEVTNDEIAYVLDNKSLIIKWVSEIEQLAIGKLSFGEEVGHYNLGQRVLKRSWKEGSLQAMLKHHPDYVIKALPKISEIEKKLDIDEYLKPIETIPTVKKNKRIKP